MLLILPAFALLEIHGPVSVLLVPVCLNISFSGPPLQYLRKPLFLSPPEASLSTELQKEETTGFRPTTILTRVFEMTPTACIFQTISSFLLSPQVSPGHLELKAPYLPSLSVDKAFFFFPSHAVGSVCPGVAEAAVWGFSCARSGGEGRAMTLLVTSDTVQPLSVNQMERKCKWDSCLMVAERTGRRLAESWLL